MFLGGLRTQIIVLLVLAVVGGTALYVSRGEDSSPYGSGSEADRMWKACERHAKASREFAMCICPVDQVVREAPEAQCLHLAMMQHSFYSENAGKPIRSADEVLGGLPKACKELQTEKGLAVYKRIVSECAIRYKRREMPATP